MSIYYFQCVKYCIVLDVIQFQSAIKCLLLSFSSIPFSNVQMYTLLYSFYLWFRLWDIILSICAIPQSVFVGNSSPHSNGEPPVPGTWCPPPGDRWFHSWSCGPSREQGIPDWCSGDLHCREHRTGMIRWKLDSGFASWHASFSLRFAGHCTVGRFSRMDLKNKLS